jgi:hypothetical protein
MVVHSIQEAPVAPPFVPAEQTPGTSEPTRVGAFAGKVASLKKAMEFSEPHKARLNKLGTEHDLLLFSYEVLLQKFMALQEIGVMGGESSRVLEALHQKFESALTSRQVEPTEGGSEKLLAENEKLREENLALHTQVSQLRAKMAKGGVISQRELELEEASKYANRRLRELKAELEVANRHIETLSVSAEMVQNLRARNSLLTARLEHQTQLLQSLTVNRPEQEELIARLQEIAVENRRLKDQLTEQADWMGDMQHRVSGDAVSKQAIAQLVKNNANLHFALDQKEERLDAMTERNSSPRFAETIQRLSDENFRLKSLLETKQAILDQFQERSGTAPEAQRIVEMLKLENRRLKETMIAKKEQVQSLAAPNPVSAKLMKVINRLKAESLQLKKEVELKDRLYRELQMERQQLQQQIRRLDVLNEENQKLRSINEHNRQVLEVLKKTEAQYQFLKKEYSGLRSKHEASEIETGNVKARLAKVMAEYDLLVKEYENLFGQLDH